MDTIRIALAGNPNSGKTTLFNALTGGRQYVGNWPGVTVEKKDGRLKGHDDIIIQDLPGIYSLSPYSQEEVIARDFLVKEHPDAILDIVDGSNIERNLYLTTQLSELGIPMIVAVNMLDVVRKNGDKIDLDKLSESLGCPVVGISALRHEGIQEAAEKAIAIARTATATTPAHVFEGSVEHAIAHIEESIQDVVKGPALRWFAIKIFERDRQAYASLHLDEKLLAHLRAHISDCEKEMDDDAESIITNQRYIYTQKVVSTSVAKKDRKSHLTLSDKIDKIVTNRFLAIPIFVAIVWFMYYIAVTTIGTWSVDWTNDRLFGDGFFIAGPGQEAYDEASEAWADAETKIADFTAAYFEKNGGSYDADHLIVPCKDGEEVVSNKVSLIITDAGKAAGIEVPFEVEDEESGVFETNMVAFADYQAAVAAFDGKPAPDPRDFGTFIPSIPGLAEKGLDAIDANDLVRGIVLVALIGGVGTILGFVPQIIIVFLFLAFLEDCGYMARIAFILDRIFRRFGLSGKSFIPMLVGMGCAVPGILAARTIESRRDRRMTIMLGTYVPCGAKHAIIAMFVTAFFDSQAWVATAMYFLGILVIALGGIALKKFRAFAGDPAPFVMELPAYHMPTVGGVLRRTWDRTRAYIVKAGTIIFACCVVLWLLMSFDWTFAMVDDIEQSMLHTIGNGFAWLFAPLGFGSWKGAVATITAEIAKEEAVAYLGMLAPAGHGVAESIHMLFTEFNGPALASVAGLSFMILNLFDPPCLVAIATTFREMGSARWGWIAVGFQFLVGYCLALVTYQLGGFFFCDKPFGFWTVVAFLVVIAFLYLLFRKPLPIDADHKD